MGGNLRDSHASPWAVFCLSTCRRSSKTRRLEKLVLRLRHRLCPKILTCSTPRKRSPFFSNMVTPKATYLKKSGAQKNGNDGPDKKEGRSFWPPEGLTFLKKNREKKRNTQKMSSPFLVCNIENFGPLTFPTVRDPYDIVRISDSSNCQGPKIFHLWAQS